MTVIGVNPDEIPSGLGFFPEPTNAVLVQHVVRAGVDEVRIHADGEIRAQPAVFPMMGRWGIRGRRGCRKPFRR
jgi:hypothetical protein